MKMIHKGEIRDTVYRKARRLPGWSVLNWGVLGIFPAVLYVRNVKLQENRNKRNGDLEQDKNLEKPSKRFCADVLKSKNHCCNFK
jgi:hypothetical protein